MTDWEPKHRWVGEDSWAHEHMDYRGWYIAIGLILLSHAVFFIVGVIVGRFLW